MSRIARLARLAKRLQAEPIICYILTNKAWGRELEPEITCWYFDEQGVRHDTTKEAFLAKYPEGKIYEIEIVNGEWDYES